MKSNWRRSGRATSVKTIVEIDQVAGMSSYYFIRLFKRTLLCLVFLRVHGLLSQQVEQELHCQSVA